GDRSTWTSDRAAWAGNGTAWASDRTAWAGDGAAWTGDGITGFGGSITDSDDRKERILRAAEPGRTPAWIALGLHRPEAACQAMVLLNQSHVVLIITIAPDAYSLRRKHAIRKNHQRNTGWPENASHLAVDGHRLSQILDRDR